MTPFDQVVAHRPEGAGRFAVEVHDGWGAPIGPNGGYVAALILNAMMAVPEVAGRDPRSVTLHYLRAPKPGPGVVEVSAERVGRSLTTLSARLVQGDRVCTLVLGVFALPFEPAAEYHAAPPPAPRPEEVRRIEPRGSKYSLLQHLDLRQTFGPAAFAGDEAVCGGWTSLAEPRALDATVLALFVDCWWPSAWGRLERMEPAPTIDLTIHFRATPRPDDLRPTLVRIKSQTAAEGYFEEDASVWDADGRLLAQARQLALLRKGLGG